MYYELGWLKLRQNEDSTMEFHPERFTPQGPVSFASCSAWSANDLGKPERYRQRFEEALGAVRGLGWERCSSSNGNLIRRALETAPTHEYCSPDHSPAGSKKGGLFSKEIYFYNVEVDVATPQGWSGIRSERVEGFDEAFSRLSSIKADLHSEGWRETEHGGILVREIRIQDSDVTRAARETRDEEPQGGSQDPLAVLERLAKLRDTGAISEEEYAAKKTEMLGRL